MHLTQCTITRKWLRKARQTLAPSQFWAQHNHANFLRSLGEKAFMWVQLRTPTSRSTSIGVFGMLRFLHSTRRFVADLQPADNCSSHRGLRSTVSPKTEPISAGRLGGPATHKKALCAMLPLSIKNPTLPNYLRRQLKTNQRLT